MTSFDPISLWPAIVRSYQEVRAEAEQALKPHGIASLEEYDVLLELRRATKPLTLSEIEGATLLKQYQLSRLVDRLVQKGLAEREVSQSDGRARLVTLTKDGRLAQKSGGRAYEDVLIRRISCRLDRNEADSLREALRKIAA